MRARWGWLYAYVLGVVFRQEHADAKALLLLILAVLLLGMLGELASIVRAARLKSEPPRRADPRPADSRSEPAQLPGLRGSPNRRDPRYLRFETFDPDEDAERAKVEVGLGALLGRVVAFSMFVGRERRGWSDEEISKTLDSLRRAADWIEREAVRWEVPVHLDLSSIYFETVDAGAGGPVEIAFYADGPFEADASNKALIELSQAAARIGFDDAADLLDKVGSRVETDARVWLLHPREAGRSLAIPEADTPWPGVTLAVCYAREAGFPEPLNAPPSPDPTTFAHELLHLFGATDKYEVPLRTFPPGSVTDRDIMCLNHRSLSRMHVDPLTAAEIGWNRTGHEKRPPRPPEGRRGGHS